MVISVLSAKATKNPQKTGNLTVTIEAKLRARRTLEHAMKTNLQSTR